MTALQIPVKTTETVQTWSTATAAIVFMDLMEQTVKMVSIAIVVFVSDPIVKNCKDEVDIEKFILFNLFVRCVKICEFLFPFYSMNF